MIFYELIIKPEGLFVKTPLIATKKEKEQLFKILLEELNLRKVVFDEQEIKKMFLKESSEMIQISDTADIDKDGKFIIEVSKDEMQAFLTIFPPLNDKKIDYLEIKQGLDEKNIVFGINEERIKNALMSKKNIIDLMIAKGKKAIPGKDAYLEYFFNPNGIEVKPQELENGKIDFYNTNIIQIVNKGQLLVGKIPSTAGIPGQTVTGKELSPLKGKDVPILVGKNIGVSKDFSKAYSLKEGHVVMINGKVEVLDVYEVKGDVDFSCGNIDYSGNVIIRGNIKNGFSVKAGGDVEIHGNIEGGDVVAEGNIFIKKGVRGLKKSKITAQRNIYSTFIENANLFAGEDVTVTEAIMHSNVNAGGIIQVGGRRGLIVGGNSQAGEAVICKNIGSNLATLTHIAVGINPILREEYNKNCQRQIFIKENLDKIQKALNIINELEKKLKKLSLDKKRLKEKLLRNKVLLLKEQEELFIKKQEQEEKIKTLNKGYIKVSDTINCGVTVSLGKANKHFSSEVRRVVLRQDGVDISILPYDS